MSTLAIKQVKSANGTDQSQRDTLRTLGLRRIGHVVERPDSAQLRGLSINEVLGLSQAAGGGEHIAAEEPADDAGAEPAAEEVPA